MMTSSILLLAAIGELGALPQGAYEKYVDLQDGLQARVVCCEPLDWRIEVSSAARARWLDELEVSISCGQERRPPAVRVEFLFPHVDMAYLWRPTFGTLGVLPDWGCRQESSLALWMPLVAALNENDRNRFLVASSETRRKVVSCPGLREEGSMNFWYFEHYTDPGEAPLRQAAFKIRIDRRDVFYGQAIQEASAWMMGDTVPLAVPEAACAPLYSTWYSFHQDVYAKDIEEECALAAEMGMKTLIVDDGWQGDNTERYYAYVGAWQANGRRFPDMAAHVKRIHALGMKYMLWYSVPFIGIKSELYEKFKGKYLCHREQSRSSVLDPRFPEVREHLIGLWEKAIDEWDIDGFKLDFIDDINLYGAHDPATDDGYAGRDVKSVPDAVNRLLLDAVRRLKAKKPDLLVEFRQQYVGPAIRQYGNMLRAADCPRDPQANRYRIGNLRLTSGTTAVHADMLEWHPDESPEEAARNVLNALFGVIQYSVMLRQVPERHRQMIAHWLKFSQDHRETLLRGEFRPHAPQLQFPLIEAESADEAVVGVYLKELCAPTRAGKTNYVINATPGDRLLVDLAEASLVTSYDTFGAAVGVKELPAGLVRLDVPPSGYVKVVGRGKGGR